VCCRVTLTRFGGGRREIWYNEHRRAQWANLNQLIQKNYCLACLLSQDSLLRFLLLARCIKNTSDRLIRHLIISCDFAEWLLILNNTTDYGRPFLTRNTPSGGLWPWVSRCDQWKWFVWGSFYCVEELLQLEVKLPIRGEEVDQHW